MRVHALFVLALVAAASAGLAQGVHAPHTLPVVDSALLERPIGIQAGIAHTHDDGHTGSVEAQQFFDQGLTYLHHFEWILAARSFNQALRADPNLPLAWVGLSIAHTELNQSAAAQRAIERARAMSARFSEHDRVHVEIRERQMAAAASPGDAARLSAYRQAIDRAIDRFPDDVELLLQRGVAESPDITDRGQGSPPGAIRFFNRALALSPDHFAAHHYLTHALENSGKFDEALAHGAAYAKSSPNIPHARHMYGHDLRRLGRIDEAIVEFEAADRLAAESFKQEGFRPEYDWHYEHNLDLLGTSYQYIGRMARADEVLKGAFALPTQNLMQAVNKRQYLVFLRARGRVDEALAAARTLVDFPHPVVSAIGHIEIGYALLAKRQFAEVASEANAALTVMKSAPEGAGFAGLPLEGLQGEFFLRTGQNDRGRAMLEAMADKARAATGPDDWAQALFMLEAAARAARDAGDWSLAERMARRLIDHDPSYAGSHYARALVAEHAGDRQAAGREFATAEKLWGHADPGLPELTESRSKAISLKR